MTDNPPECTFDLNPLGGLCRVLDEQTHRAILGPLVGRALWGMAIFAIVLVAGRISRGIVHHALDRANTDAQVRTLVNNVMVAATLVLAVLAGITGVGVPLSVLLTFGGLTSLAIGLAFQDVLRNVLAGIFLLIERPFLIGDLVTIGELTGKVQTIELRTTSLRLGDGRLAVIPNLTAFNGNVINASASEVRQFTVAVWVPPERDLGEAMRGARAVLREVTAIEKEPAPKVLPELGPDRGTTLRCQYWLHPERDDPDTVAADVVRRLSSVLDQSAPRPAARSRGVAASASNDPPE